MSGSGQRAIDMNRRIKRWLLLISIALLLAGCVSDDAKVFVLSEECPLPCWDGIIPGETSTDEAERLIKARYGEESTYRIDKHSVGWSFPDTAYGPTSGVMTSASDVVYSITLEYDNRRLFLEELIQELGEPASLVIYSNSSHTSCSLELLYPQYETSVTLFPAGLVGGVTPARSIKFLILAQQGTMDELIDSQPLHGQIIAWAGFREYC
jgi:hypothetical protein